MYDGFADPAAGGQLLRGGAHSHTDIAVCAIAYRADGWPQRPILIFRGRSVLKAAETIGRLPEVRRRRRALFVSQADFATPPPALISTARATNFQNVAFEYSELCFKKSQGIETARLSLRHSAGDIEVGVGLAT